MQNVITNYHRKFLCSCFLFVLFCPALLLPAGVSDNAARPQSRTNSLGTEIIIDVSPWFIEHIYFNVCGKFNLLDADLFTLSLRPALGLDWQILRFRLLLSADFFNLRQSDGEKIFNLFLAGGFRGEEITNRYQVVSSVMAGGDIYLNQFLMLTMGVDVYIFRNEYNKNLSTDFEAVLSGGFRF